ncbi:phage tail terminator protein [Neorhizobium petrolearium]|uniref:phage tail terminator protein n=1 Tax=Neorhizobium petrolearium TaxID=515361 RepID=UPI003F81BBAA
MIQSIIDRLMEPGTPFRIWGGASELAAVKDYPPQTPAVYVYSARDLSEPSQLVGTFRQRTATDIGVVYVTSNLSKANNAAAADDIEALKSYGRGKLVGFRPDGAIDLLQHVEGELQQALAGTVWFEDVFSTAYHLKKGN